MAGHSHEEIRKHVRTYIIIFLSLLLGTAITVGLYYVHFDSVAVTVAIAMFVATVKASLVAAYFMHLISERKAIYTILGCTVFLFAGLMVLTLWSNADPPETAFSTQTPAHGTKAAAAHVP